MEVAAGRWRQQWAGAAEYGKVVDGVGGVTRMARALEVMQASGPGARMRVTRSTFHSTGPLSTSYVFHSSKRTILSSSRAEDLVSPNLVWKPQEVSSIPMDTASDSCPEGEEPYKVTEPDDNDISEPSKWRSAQGRSTLSVPSEESSSADNSSFADLPTRANKIVSSVNRLTDSSKTSSTSSQSVINEETKPLRASFRRKPTSEPLMKIAEHAKCLESTKSKTAKQKDEWHDRRNSYGFEDSILSGIKYLSESNNGMDSSTDSGICKSTELVNTVKSSYTQDIRRDHKDIYKDNAEKDSKPTESFRDWLSKNRTSSAFKTDFSSSGRIDSDSKRSDFNSLGKISISLPKFSDRENSDYDDNNTISNNNNLSDYSDKKFKKVGFSKTELHFAAESGIVNIIETDEKPPPKTDFRKRRSAFVSIKNVHEKPITLFGSAHQNDDEECIEKINFAPDNIVNTTDRFNIENDNEINVKSILKNKIPKPRPYLLGEDCERSWDEKSSVDNECVIKSPVSILNESLKMGKRTPYIPQSSNVEKLQWRDHDTITNISTKSDFTNSLREKNKSPNSYVNLLEIRQDMIPNKSVASTQTSEELLYDMIKSCASKENAYQEDREQECEHLISPQNIQEKLQLLKMSPIMPTKAKTRDLRQNELSYFGIQTEPIGLSKTTHIPIIVEEHVKIEPTKSRKVIKYQPPLYQNIPLRPVPVPVPAPRSFSSQKKDDVKKSRSKTEENENNTNEDESKHLKPFELEKLDEYNVTRDTSNYKKSNKKENQEIKNRNYSSPIYIKVESSSKASMQDTKKKESASKSKNSSVDDCRHDSVTKQSRHLKNADTSNVEPDNRLHSDPERRTPSKELLKDYATSVSTKSRTNHETEHCKSRSSSVDSRRKDIRNHITNDHSRSRSQSGRKHSGDIQTIREEHQNKSDKSKDKEVAKRQESRVGSHRNKAKEKTPKDIILNYDEKNGTLSSVRKSKSAHAGRTDRERRSAEKSESKPKEVKRMSRVATMELKNAMTTPRDSHHRNKNIEYHAQRKKQGQEPPQ